MQKCWSLYLCVAPSCVLHTLVLMNLCSLCLVLQLTGPGKDDGWNGGCGWDGHATTRGHPAIPRKRPQYTCPTFCKAVECIGSHHNLRERVRPHCTKRFQTSGRPGQGQGGGPRWLASARRWDWATAYDSCFRTHHTGFRGIIAGASVDSRSRTTSVHSLWHVSWMDSGMYVWHLSKNECSQFNSRYFVCFLYHYIR